METSKKWVVIMQIRKSDRVKYSTLCHCETERDAQREALRRNTDPSKRLSVRYIVAKAA